MALDLPPGWTVTGQVENVPNPNFGTPYGQNFFARQTYICTDDRGDFVCASGSEDDCNNQAQTAAQSRTQQQPYNEAI
jgi:hypothetical protein